MKCRTCGKPRCNWAKRPSPSQSYDYWCSEVCRAYAYYNRCNRWRDTKPWEDRATFEQWFALKQQVDKFRVSVQELDGINISPKLGRPKKAAADRRGIVMRIRLTQDEYKAVAAKAENAGVTISKYAHSKLKTLAHGRILRMRTSQQEAV